MSTDRQQNGSGRRRIGFGLLGVEADGLADELFARLRALGFVLDVIEGNAGVLETFLRGQPHPQKIAESGGFGLELRQRLVDSLHKRMVAPVVSEIDPVGGHTTGYSLYPHKSLHELTHLRTVVRRQHSASYNTPGDKVETKQAERVRARQKTPRVSARDRRALFAVRYNRMCTHDPRRLSSIGFLSNLSRSTNRGVAA